MFKKKLLSAILSASLVAAMLPTGVMASDWNTNGGEATVEGGSYIVEPIIEVELPGDLTFGINPLYLDADEDGDKESTQIVSGQYIITNYSNVDVLVSAKTSLTKGADSKVSILTDTTVDSISGELAATADVKNAFLAIMLPKAAATITDEGVTITTNIVDLATNGDSAADEIGGYVLGTDAGAATEVLFKLTKFDYTTEELAAANVSGFTFDGAVDPNATFVEGDLTVQTVFTLNTLTDDQSSGSYEPLELNSATFDSTIVQVKSGS